MPSRPRSVAAWSRTVVPRRWARSLRKPLPEDLDVMHASRDELAMLHRALQPLSRA